MQYTAQNIKDNAWIVNETDDNGHTKKHNVFCKVSENTEQHAINLIKNVVDIVEVE